MRVLVPVEHPGQTGAILDRCQRFADAGRCSVVLAHVTPPGYHADAGRMENCLTDATRTLRQAGLDAMFVVRAGDPAEELAHLAHDLDAVLLMPA